MCKNKEGFNILLKNVTKWASAVDLFKKIFQRQLRKQDIRISKT